MLNAPDANCAGFFRLPPDPVLVNAKEKPQTKMVLIAVATSECSDYKRSIMSVRVG